jgi:uncharacterized protein YjbI with pentapeptide repeats
VRVVKPNQISVLSRPYDHDNKYRICVTGLILFPFAEPGYPMSESALWLLAGKELGDAVLDECMPKENGEILMRASAYAPQGKPHGVVRSAVELDGRPLKEVAVVGDRVWKNGVPTEPEPFVTKRIRWEDAFGGSGFKPNPLGKGYQPKEGSPLPNIEDRRRLITSMSQTPEPAGVGPYDVTWPQRMAKAGTYDKAWFDRYYPGLARDIDWGFFNVAPKDQQIHGFFRGDEELVFRNLHPDRPDLTCRLPSVQLRCFMRRKRRSGEEVDAEIEMKLDTLWLFPHAAHGILVFHGTARVREDDASDVSVLYLGCEDLGEPKPLEHYMKVLEQRLGKEHGAIAALDDRPLMPRLRGDMKRPPSPTDEMAEIVATEHLAYKNMMKKGERHVMETRALLVAEGLDPDEHGPVPFDDVEMTGSLEEMLARADRVEKELAEKRARAEKAMAEAEAELERICAETGLDFEEIQQEWRGPGRAGPPEPSAEKDIARMKQLAHDSRAAGFDAREIDDYLADPQFVAMIRAQDKAKLDAYRAGAHDQPAPEIRSYEESARLRAELVEAHARGESLAGRDLTGADLAGIQLPGANLEEALMELCDLTSANLSGANLKRAVLVRATLCDARLDGANLDGANLSKADCSRASFANGQLRDAMLLETRLSSASLDGVSLDRALLNDAKLDRVSLRGIKAEGMMLDGLDLEGTSFAGAALADAVFMKCALDRVDFTGANLAGATLFGCRAVRAIFAKISGKSLRIVEGTTLDECDFREADLEIACLRGTRLVRCDFTAARAPLADFSECDLTDACLYHLYARQARFVRADLTRANVVGADLFEASLSKAVLAGTRLNGANLYQSDLALVRSDGETQLGDTINARARFKPSYSDKAQDLD